MKSIAPNARGLSADLCCCSFVTPLLMPDCIMVTHCLHCSLQEGAGPALVDSTTKSVLGACLMASCRVSVARLCTHVLLLFTLL